MMSLARRGAIAIKKTVLRRSDNFSRRHERFPCNIAAQLAFPERGFSLDGQLNEMSLGGGRFRPVLTHILERHGDGVLLIVGDRQLEANIVNTTPFGYGLRLREPITGDVLRAIVALKPIDI